MQLPAAAAGEAEGDEVLGLEAIQGLWAARRRLRVSERTTQTRQKNDPVVVPVFLRVLDVLGPSHLYVFELERVIDVAGC